MSSTPNNFAPLPTTARLQAALAGLQDAFLQGVDQVQGESGHILLEAATRQARTIAEGLDKFDKRGTYVFATAHNLGLLEDLMAEVQRLDVPTRADLREVWSAAGLELRDAALEAAPAMGLNLRRTDFGRASLELLETGARNSFGDLSDFASLQKSQIVGLKTAVADGLVRGIDWRSLGRQVEQGGIEGLGAIPGFRRAFGLQERGQMIARTETVRIQTQLQDAFGEEAGLDWGRSFLNWHLQKHHELCLWAEALGWAPLEAFTKGPGLPPRHPNCGCFFQRGLKDWVDPSEGPQQLAAEFARKVAEDRIKVSPQLLAKLPDQTVEALRDSGALRVGRERRRPLVADRAKPFEEIFSPHLLRDGRQLVPGKVEAPLVERFGAGRVDEVYRAAELALGRLGPDGRGDTQAVVEQLRQDRTGFARPLRQIAESGALTAGELEELRSIALEHKTAERELRGEPSGPEARAVRRLHRSDIPDLVEEYMAQVEEHGGLSFESLDIDDAIQWLRELPRDSDRQGAAVFGKELWASVQSRSGKVQAHEERFVGSRSFWERCIRMAANVALAQFGEDATVEQISLPISVHDAFGGYRELPAFQDARSSARFEPRHWDAEARAYYAERIDETARYTEAWTGRFDELVDVSRKILGLRTALGTRARALGAEGAAAAAEILGALEQHRFEAFGIRPGAPVELPSFEQPPARPARVRAPAPPESRRPTMAEQPFARRRDLFVGEWTNGSRGRLAVALKEAAREVFESAAIAYSRRDYRFEADELEAARATVRDLHDQTQLWAERNGVRTIRLYRGIKSPYAVEGVLESWTTDPATARKFDGHEVLVRDVPVEDLLFGHEVPGWRNGRFGQQFEWIVINGRRRFEELADDWAPAQDIGFPAADSGADDIPF